MANYSIILALFIIAVFNTGGTVYAQQKWLNTTNAACGMQSGDADVKNTALTVEAVIYFDQSPTGTVSVVSKHANANVSDANYVLRPDRFQFVTGTNTLYTVTNPCTLLPGRCYHIAGVYDGQRAYYYVNGCLVNQINATGNLKQNNVNVGVGYRSNGAELFRGYMDEVRVWAAVRTRAQLRQWMFQPLVPSTQTGLVLYFNFDAYVSGNTVNNLAGGPASLNGTLCTAVVSDNDVCTGAQAANEFSAFNTGPACRSGSVTLGVEPAVEGATYQWSGPGGFSASGESVSLMNFNAFQAGIYRVIRTLGCCSDTAYTRVYMMCEQVPIGASAPTPAEQSLGSIPTPVYQIVILPCSDTLTGIYIPWPNINATAYPPSIEVGGSAQLYVSGGAQSYVWQPGGMTGTSITVSPTETTTYTVTGYTAQGCATTRTVTVFVNCPNLEITTSATNVCQGQTVLLASAEATMYKVYVWEPSHNLSSPNGAYVFALMDTTVTYTVTGYTPEGCLDQTTVTVTVGDGVSGLFASQTRVCESARVELRAVGNFLQWYENGVPIPPPPTQPRVIYPQTSTTYRVTGVDQIGCPFDRSVALEVTPALEVTATGATICPGGTATLTAAGADSLIWFPGGISGASLQVSAQSTRTYTVVGYSPGRCPDSAIVVLNVGPFPQGTSPTTLTICDYETPTLSVVNPPAEATYTWAPATYLNTTVGPAVVASPASSITYTVTGILPDGCQEIRIFTLNVTGTVSVQVNALQSQVCRGASTILTASGAVSYIWFPGGQTGPYIDVVPTETTTYTVEAFGNMACHTFATVTVTVVDAANIVLDSDVHFACPGQPVRLWGRGGVQYHLNPGNRFLYPGDTLVVRPTQTTNYTLVGTSSSGCSAVAQMTLNVLPPMFLQPPNIIGPDTVCYGSTAVFSSDRPLLWEPFGVVSSELVLPDVEQTTTMTAYAVDGYECRGYRAKTVRVTQVPEASITGPTVLCNGSTATLSVNVRRNGVLESPVRFEYLWNNGQTTRTITVSQGGTYVVRVSDRYGCVVEAAHTVYMPPLPTLNVPVQTACLNGPLIPITFSPPGGTLRINGTVVPVGVFNPGIWGVGNHTVSYRYSTPEGCVYTVERSVRVVHPTLNVPVSLLCANADPVPISYTPAEAVVRINGQSAPALFDPGVWGVGTHVVSLTHPLPDGCTYLLTHNITVVPATLAATTTVTQASCASCSDGGVHVSPSGGTPPYRFSLDGVNFTFGYQLMGLAPGMYTLHVRDANGCKFSMPFRVTVCATPQEINAQPLTPNSVRLTWQNVGGPFSVRFRRVGTLAWSMLNNLNASSIVLSGLTAGATYQYYVVTSCGTSTATRTFALGMPPPPCTAPEILAVVVSGPETSISWTATPGATHYELSLVPTGGQAGDATVHTLTQTSMTLPHPSETFTVRLRAYCAEGGTFSAWTERQVTAPPCPQAQNIRLQCENGRWRARWEAPSFPDFWTVAWRVDNANDNWMNTTIHGTGLEFELPADLGAGLTYMFRVRARCGSFFGPWSPTTSFFNHCTSTQPCPNALNVVVQCESGQYVARWTTPGGTHPEFWTTMWRRNLPGENWANATISGNFASFVIPGNFVLGAGYQFRIRSRCGSIINQPSSVVSFTADCGARLAAMDASHPTPSWIVYPNPATNVLNVYSPEAEVVLDVYDALGRRTLRQKLNEGETTIRIETWTAGMYNFRFVSGDVVVGSEKVVVVR